MIHSDIWGSIWIPNTLGFIYFVSFMDDHSKTTWIYLLKDKSEYPFVLDSFYHEIKIQFDVLLKILQSDNALNTTL